MPEPTSVENLPSVTSEVPKIYTQEDLNVICLVKQMELVESLRAEVLAETSQIDFGSTQQQLIEAVRFQDSVEHHFRSPMKRNVSQALPLALAIAKHEKGGHDKAVRCLMLMQDWTKERCESVLEALYTQNGLHKDQLANKPKR